MKGVSITKFVIPWNPNHLHTHTLSPLPNIPFLPPPFFSPLVKNFLWNLATINFYMSPSPLSLSYPLSLYPLPFYPPSLIKISKFLSGVYIWGSRAPLSNSIFLSTETPLACIPPFHPLPDLPYLYPLPLFIIIGHDFSDFCQVYPWSLVLSCLGF